MLIPLRTAAAAAILMAAALNLSTRANAQTPPANAVCRGLSGEGPGFAHPGGGGVPGAIGWMAMRGHDHGMPPWMRGLGLTSAQKDQVFQILHDHEIALRDAAKLAHAQRSALHQASLTAGTSPAQLQTLATAAGQADSALALQMAQTDQLLLAVLSPDQQNTLSSCLASLAATP